MNIFTEIHGRRVNIYFGMTAKPWVCCTVRDACDGKILFEKDLPVKFRRPKAVQRELFDAAVAYLDPVAVFTRKLLSV